MCVWYPYTWGCICVHACAHVGQTMTRASSSGVPTLCFWTGSLIGCSPTQVRTCVRLLSDGSIQPCSCSVLTASGDLHSCPHSWISTLPTEPPLRCLFGWQGLSAAQAGFEVMAILPSQPLDCWGWNHYSFIWKSDCFLNKISVILIIMSTLLPKVRRYKSAC